MFVSTRHTQSVSVSRSRRYGSINFGHSAEIDFAIFAYPYPGRSAKIRVGLTFIFSPAPSCRAKKLIARVLPGVEDTFASRDPSRELINDDFPTFDRPRNATSGAPNVFASEGKCATSVADNKKTGFNRMDPVYRRHPSFSAKSFTSRHRHKKKHLSTKERTGAGLSIYCGSYHCGGTVFL